MKNRWIALWVVLSMLTASSHAATYHVDDNAPNDPAPYFSGGSDTFEDGSPEHPFDSIQKAINIAVDGDTIVVAPGRYLSPDKWRYEELKFKGKNIRLVSSAPADFDVADQTVLCGVVIFDGTETSDCLLQGFKVQNYAYGGIVGNNTQARISHCIISGNGPCGATVVMDVQGRISNCLIVDNTTFHDCGVMPVVWGCAELVNCTIANNLSALGTLGETPIIRNCIIYGNQSLQTSVARATRGGSTSSEGYSYNLIENANAAVTIVSDPGFVRLGRWEDVPTSTPGTRATRAVIVAAEVVSLNKVLIEGDYHLKSEGWRWSPELAHGSHWYFDISTSPAIDAGDPMDSLGDELERIPDDPEGLLGVNHAINLGAYGGTAQASLAPRKGDVPGVGAVDLLDYWPLTGTYNKWYVHDPQGNTRQIYVTTRLTGAWGEVYYVRTANAPDWVTMVYSYYADRTLYMAENAPVLDPSRPLPPPAHAQARYPRYLVAGSTIQAPYDPFVKGGAEYRSVLVLRGALADVLADTSVDPNQILTGSWPDVIALRETGDDGTTGDPIAIYARGFGPLLLAGQPTKGAVVNSRTFGTGTGGTGTRATR